MNLVTECDLQRSFFDPLFGPFDEFWCKIIVHKHGAARHQDRVQVIACSILNQCAEHGDGAPSFLVKDPFHKSGGGCFFEISDHDSTNVWAQRLHFDVDDFCKGSHFRRSIGHDSTNWGGAWSGASFCDLDAQHAKSSDHRFSQFVIFFAL